jgi:RHS repeat-associated protein
MVSEEAGSSWQHLQLRVPIEEIGYIYIYVINESMDGVDVYFDDAEVQLIDAPLTSASDYYPYGLPICYRSYSSEHYRYGYQSQFAEKDEETGWNAFEARMWESTIGRWMAVDPSRQYPSLYLGMGNNPINGVDIDGGWADKYFDSETGDLVHDTGQGDNAYIAQYDEQGNLQLGKGFIGLISEMSSDPRSLVFDEVLLSMEARFEFEGSIYGGIDINVPRNKRFASLVGTGKEFDFKNKVGSMWDESSDLGRRMAIWNNRLMRPDDWGNFAFGVGAKSYGFSRGWAIFGAGAAQVMAGFEWKQKAYHGSELGNYPNSVSYIGLSPKYKDIYWSNFRGFFDGPRDTHLIKAGYNILS